MPTGDLVLDTINMVPAAILWVSFTLVCLAGIIWSGIESERN